MANKKSHSGANVPALRFPEFSGEWTQCTLGDITYNFSHRNKEHTQHPMFSVTNNRGFVPQSEQFEDREMVGEDIQAYKVIEKGDFAYNPARINVGSIAKYEGEEKCMISSLYVCFRVADNIDREWFMQLLKTPKMNFHYNLNGEGGVRVYLFYPNFARIRSSFPSIAEQLKISRLLNLIDERIITQSRIIEEQETLLKSLRVDLLNHAAFTAKQQKIRDILTIAGGKDYQHLDDGDIPVYGTGGLMCYVSSYLYDGESVCIGRKGTINKPFYLNGRFWTVDTLFYTHSFNGIRPRYCYHLFCTIDWLAYNEASGVPSLSKSTIEKITVSVPAIETQDKIVSILDAVEHKIHMDRSVLRSYEVQKNYLLSRMFI